MYNREKKDKYRTRIEKLFGRKRSRDNSDNSRNRPESICNTEGSGDTNNPDGGSGNINNLDDSDIDSGSNTINSGSGNIRISRWTPANTRIEGIRKYLEVYEIA